MYKEEELKLLNCISVAFGFLYRKVEVSIAMWLEMV